MVDFDRSDTRKPRWTVHADFSKDLNRSAIGSSDCACRHWFQVLNHVEMELKRGATEVRIRPVKP